MKKQHEKRIIWKDLRSEIRQHKVTFAVYLVLRTIVIAAMILSLIRGDYENLFVCTLSLILFLVPAFAEKNLGIQLPTALEVTILLFVFASEILGEMSSFYVRVPYWDTILHTVNGFMCAAVGFALVDILNRNKRVKLELSPLFLAVIAFCFSMTVGVLWEFFECGADLLVHSDMQKDTVVEYISSVKLDPTQSNKPVVIKDITDVTVNGESLGLGGYLDIGLYDTMKDLFVNFIGAAVFSVIGFFYVRGRAHFARGLIPTVKEQEPPEKG